MLGGKDNYPVDREAAQQILSLIPNLRDTVRAERAFLIRAVGHLVGEVGIHQFLDIGTGLPTANNTHQVAQTIVPECRIVYVDNDLNFITNDDEARAIVKRLMGALSSNSYLLLSHPTAEVDAEAMERAMRLWNDSGAAR